MSKFSKHHAIIGTNTHASFHMYPQRKAIKVSREDMQTLSMVRLLKELKTPLKNLLPFSRKLSKIYGIFKPLERGFEFIFTFW